MSLPHQPSGQPIHLHNYAHDSTGRRPGVNNVPIYILKMPCNTYLYLICIEFSSHDICVIKILMFVQAACRPPSHAPNESQSRFWLNDIKIYWVSVWIPRGRPCLLCLLKYLMHSWFWPHSAMFHLKVATIILCGIQQMLEWVYVQEEKAKFVNRKPSQKLSMLSFELLIVVVGRYFCLSVCISIYYDRMLFMAFV